MGAKSQKNQLGQSDWILDFDRSLTPFVRLVIWALLFQLIMVVYWPALKAPFLYDDIPCIVTNPDLRYPSELGRFFSNHESSMQFDHRPLVGILTMLNFQAAGLDVIVYRIFNLIIHWSVAIVLGEFIIRIADHFKLRGGRLLGILTAVFWALHPLNTVTVIFIAQRMESLMVLFYLLALWSLFKSGRQGNLLHLGGALLAAIACLASKEVGVTLLASFLMLDRVCHFQNWRELLSHRWKFYVAAMAVWSVFLFWWQSGERIAELQGMVLSDPLLYFQTQCRVLVEYVRKVFWPSKLVFVGSPKVPGSWLEWFPHALMLTGGFLVCAKVALKSHKWVWIPAILFFFVLGPTSSFLPIPQEPEAEWRMYLPSGCLLVLILALVGSLMRKFEISRGVAVASIALMVMVLSVASWQRAKTFRSSVSIWSDNVAKDPFASKAWINLGVAHYNEENMEGVAQVSQVLWNLGTRFDDARLRANSMFFASWIAVDQEDFPKAESLLQKALSEEPDGRYRNDLAHVLIRQNKLQEALEQLKIRLSKRPEDPYSLALYGEVMIKSGHEEEGRKALDHSEMLFPQAGSLKKIKYRLNENRILNSSD
jgi:hypothetical protein